MQQQQQQPTRSEALAAASTPKRRRIDDKIEGGEAMDQITNVYVWDMDETLILLKSLLNGTYAEAFSGSKDVQKGVEIGEMWEDQILRLCDDVFFYKQIEDYNMPFLDALQQYDDERDLSDYDFNQDGIGLPDDDPNKRKLAYRHRFIANKYKQGLHNILNQEEMNSWDELYNLTDEYTERWLSSACSFLEQCSGRRGETTAGLASASGIHNNDTKLKHINVLVTSGSLIPSLAKCLLFRLDNIIMHGNVYSSWEVGKPQCFRWIKERFNNPNFRFCVIGDGWEECEAAQAMQWPFVRIDLRPGSGHRFPGLTLGTLGHYFSIVYGSPNATNEEDKSSSPE